MKYTRENYINNIKLLIEEIEQEYDIVRIIGPINNPDSLKHRAEACGCRIHKYFDYNDCFSKAACIVLIKNYLLYDVNPDLRFICYNIMMKLGLELDEIMQSDYEYYKDTQPYGVYLYDSLYERGEYLDIP